MKYEVILHNKQGACFSEKLDTKEECQEYLNSFADPENLTGRIIDNETGEEVAIKNNDNEFEWK